MTQSDLVLNNVVKSFAGTSILAGVSIRIPAGKTTSLLGPSGCGKTTLLRIVAGLESPESGSVSFGSQTLVDEHAFVPPERRRIGMMFQEGALFPHLSVRENVAYGLARSDIAAGRVEDVLRLVDLEGFGDRNPGSLSGGQAQRVALARALAPRPDLLLLDEPFSSLDPELRVRVRGDLVHLLDDLGMTTLFVTHDQEEAFVVGGRVAVMQAGRIVQEGEPADVYEHPNSAWLARFVGEANLIAATAHQGGAMTDIGLVPTITPLDGDSLVLIRPEYLELGHGEHGTVKSVEFYGHDTSYVVTGIGDTLSVRELRAPRFRVGDSVNVVYAGRPTVAFASS